MYAYFLIWLLVVSRNNGQALSIAFFNASKAVTKTERGHPTFMRMNPSPPGPNMLPSFNNNPALSLNRLTNSGWLNPSSWQSSQMRKEACGK